MSGLRLSPTFGLRLLLKKRGRERGGERKRKIKKEGEREKKMCEC